MGAVVPKLGVLGVQISLMLFVKRSRLDVRKFFSQRVVPHWNGLPEHFVITPSTNAFKNHLDKRWTDMGN